MNAYVPPATTASVADYPYHLVYRFDELRLFPGSAALATGEASIGFGKSGRWGITAIDLDADYGGGTVYVPTDQPIHRLVRDALQVQEAARIADEVDARLSNMGIERRDPNAEHRLGAVALGLLSSRA